MKTLVIALALALHALAGAETFPSKPIRIVVPFPPGGGSDAVARALSTKLGESLRQSVIVENRPGAGGLLATTQVAAAPADGYTLLLADTPFTANVSVYPSPGYSTRDFSPVGPVASIPFFVVVGNHVPVKSLGELVALAKSKPDQLNMASGGAGGVAHLQGARFASMADVKWTHVPYKGMAPAILDVIGGQADVMFASAPTAVPHLKSGRVKPLAISSPSRSPLAPDVPTLAELGYPAMTAEGWYGLVAPGKTSPVVVKKLLDHINAAVGTPEVRTQLSGQMAAPFTMATSQEFASLIQKDTEIWAKAVKAANITPN